jgi:hypothetical protein
MTPAGSELSLPGPPTRVNVAALKAPVPILAFTWLTDAGPTTGWPFCDIDDRGIVGVTGPRRTERRRREVASLQSLQAGREYAIELSAVEGVHRTGRVLGRGLPDGDHGRRDLVIGAAPVRKHHPVDPAAPHQRAASVEIHDLRTGRAEFPCPAAAACRRVGRFGRATERMEREKGIKADRRELANEIVAHDPGRIRRAYGRAWRQVRVQFQRGRASDDGRTSLGAPER